MNVRNLKGSDAYQRAANRYVIEKGSKNIQLTEAELLDLQKQLNKFVLHNVSNNEVTVCDCGSPVYGDSDQCAMCIGRGYSDRP